MNIYPLKTTNRMEAQDFAQGKRLSFFQLFEREGRVVIPIVQREYAQGRQEPAVEVVRRNFVRTIFNYLADGKPFRDLDFIYGASRNGCFVPLDGQQRLTTLFLLHWYLCQASDNGALKKKYRGRLLEDGHSRFSYETRDSSAAFCDCLMGCEVGLGEMKEARLSDHLRNEAWFFSAWKQDATIQSMLVMLDEIHSQFAGRGDFFASLLDESEPVITFLFIDMAAFRRTDDLYVKMNSRGKPLTTFEHFKAVLEGLLKKLDTEEDKISERFSRKMDADWTDMLWDFRAESGELDTIDDEMVNYIRFVADVIYVRNGGARRDGKEDILTIAEDLFGNAESRRKNALFLEQMLDIWYRKDAPSHRVELFDKLYSKGAHEPGKIAVHINLGQGETVNVFRNSLRGRLTFDQFTWLYAVTVWLRSGDVAKVDECVLRRLRTVNNLINATGLGAENIGTVLGQVDKIVRDGVVEYAPNGFDKAQIEEEQAKWDHIDKHPEDAEQVYKLEDHPLLRGTIYIVGLDHLKLCDKFYALFCKDIKPLLRCCALLAQGDYSQLVETNMHDWGWPMYRFSTAKKGREGEDSWLDLFHPSHYVRKEELNERTGRVLCELLERLDSIDNVTLQGVVNRYLEETKAKAQLDWRYYMVCYAVCLMGNGNGCYAWRCVGDEEDPYLFFCLSGNTFRQTHWVALLHILQRKRENCASLPTARHGYSGIRKHEIPLVLRKNGEERFFIRLQSSGYEVYNNKWEFVRHVEIEQKDGVDTQDRIEIGLKLIDELLQKC